MRYGWLVLLAACGAPISNAPFLEEARFLGALPSRERLGPPANVFLAPSSDSSVLSAAKQAATEYDALVTLPILIGDRLRGVVPTQRTDIRRAWDPTELLLDPSGSLPVAASSLTAWIQGSVEIPSSGDLVLELQLARDRDGPWTQVASGTYDGERAGTLSWDLAATATALELQPTIPLAGLEVNFDDLGQDDLGDRQLDASYGHAASIAQLWVIVSDAVLGFSGLLQVTEDGALLPGGATVVHTAYGGWGVGTVLTATGELAFETCWSEVGLTVYEDGDEGVRRSGDRSACVEGALEP